MQPFNSLLDKQCQLEFRMMPSGATFKYHQGIQQQDSERIFDILSNVAQEAHGYCQSLLPASHKYKILIRAIWQHNQIHINQNLFNAEIYFGMVVQIHIRRSEQNIWIPLLWQHSARDPFRFHEIYDPELLLTEIEAAIMGAYLSQEQTLPVILDPFLAATFIHECIGHTSEADNYMQLAKPEGTELGYQWSSLPLNVFDDPLYFSHKGSYGSDHENTIARKVHIIKNGIWSDILCNQHYASLLDREPSGNARRTYGMTTTLPRMSNTYIQPGSHTLSELVNKISHGYFCSGSWGGISSNMNMLIRPSFAKLILHGKMTNTYLRGFDLLGDKRDLLQKLDGIGSDFRIFDPCFGCDKFGQNNLSISFGSPSLSFSQMKMKPIQCRAK